MGIKDQLQTLCGRMDKIIPPLEEQNQQIAEGIVESQIESQEKTKDSKDFMPPLKDSGDDDLDSGDALEIPLSGRVFQACEDFNSRTNPFEEGGNDMNHMEAMQLIIQMDLKEHIEDIGSHEDKINLDRLYLNHEDNALNDDLKLHQSPINISHTKKF